MEDTKVRYNPAERQAIREHRVRCLSSQGLTADQMASRFLDHLGSIVVACEEVGPFLYTVHQNRIERPPL